MEKWIWITVWMSISNIGFALFLKDLVKMWYPKFNNRFTRILLLIPPLAVITFTIIALIITFKGLKSYLND